MLLADSVPALAGILANLPIVRGPESGGAVYACSLDGY